MSGRGRGRGRAGGRGGYMSQSGGMGFLRRSAEECGLDARNIRSLQDIIRPPLFPDICLRISQSRAAELVVGQGQSPDEQNSQIQRGGHHTPSEVAVSNILSPSDVYLIGKSREIHHRIQSSAFYVRPSKEVPDVARYSDKKRSHGHRECDEWELNKSSERKLHVRYQAHQQRTQLVTSRVLSHCLGGQTRASFGRFVPEELLHGQRVLQRGRSFEKKVLLEDFEAREELKRPRGESEGGDVSVGETVPNAAPVVATAGEIGDEAEEEDYELVEDDEEAEEVEDYVANYYESADDSDGGGGEEATF